MKTTGARAAGRLPAFYKENPPGVAFYTLQEEADPELMRIVHSFDAILVLTGSRPSRPLP